MNRHPAAMPPEGIHRYVVRVYYEDTDAGGVVYHASYLRFAERARTEALRDLGIPHADLLQRYTLMFMVRRIEVDYLRSARVDDSLVVETIVTAVGGASVGLRQVVRGPAGDCAVLTMRLACIAPGEGGHKPGRLPPQWRGVLQAMCDARAGAAATDTGAARRGAA